MKFVFADGQDICLYDDGKISKFPSKFIERYKDNCLQIERSKNWKHSGEGAAFRGDITYGKEDETKFDCKINGVFLSDEGNEAVYTFRINDTSGVYKLRLDDEKAPETHVTNSLEQEFGGGSYDAASNTLALSVSTNDFNSHIAVIDVEKNDIKTVTDGDTMEIDPHICRDNRDIIYFSSRGAGRTSKGEFVRYSPASICKIDLERLTVDEVKSDPKFNYFKPIIHNGKLYAIKAPLKEKGPNPIVEILLIPFRIIQAIANFINAFVRMFTGKSLAGGGSNPTKARDYDSRKEFIKGNLIDVEKQMKKNQKGKNGDGGFIPMSWQLVEVESGEVIKSGVLDYDILDDGTFITTNGKNIFSVKDGKSTKLCSAQNCMTLSCLHKSQTKSDIFD